MNAEALFFTSQAPRIRTAIRLTSGPTAEGQPYQFSHRHSAGKWARLIRSPRMAHSPLRGMSRSLLSKPPTSLRWFCGGSALPGLDASCFFSSSSLRRSMLDVRRSMFIRTRRTSPSPAGIHPGVASRSRRLFFVFPIRAFPSPLLFRIPAHDDLSGYRGP